MSNGTPGPVGPAVDQYPWRIIFVRWTLLGIEAVIALRYMLGIQLELAILYLAYGVVCLFLLLPLIRCVRCSYYGRRCNFGWGTWVARIFPRDEANSQSDFYGYTILFWPLRLFPILLGFRDVVAFGAGLIKTGIFEPPLLIPLAYFAAYIAVIAIHRRFYRAASCTRCHERLCCPVYNSRVMQAGVVPAGRVPGPTP
jgi:hypothetical protein